MLPLLLRLHFAQMARYFVLNDVQKGENIDDIGLSMLFYKVLSEMNEHDLRVYGGIRTDAHHSAIG